MMIEELMIPEEPTTNRYENIPTYVYEYAGKASKNVAREIADLIKAKEDKGEHCVLGLATGSSPKGVYDELIRLHLEEGLSFKNVITFNLDEYYPMQPNELQSYVRFMHEYLFDHIDIKPENIHIPDGTIKKSEVQAFCDQYEKAIVEAGGIDLQLLGIGRTGHIGFNEPGSGENSGTRLITLDHITRVDAANDFFGEEYVPRNAITMGIGSIMKSKRVILLAWGEGKASIIKKTIEGNITDTVPATFLQKHKNATIVLDQAAAARLRRLKEPWLFVKCEWTSALMRKAVTNLSRRLDKPILKLTERDYNDNGLSDLVTEHGPAYNINIKIFNDLQHTITGWPGGKPNTDDTHRPERAEPAKKRVVIFSPHPDDDVISMGGTLIRLHDQGHDVHVAYQTSGNIAVFDEDALRFAEFVKDYNDDFKISSKDSDALFDDISKNINDKAPGAIDSENVRKVKGLIRRGEAKAACRYIGIEEEHVHFLNMPFYETGLIKKKPLGDNDIEEVVELLREIKPHQIYAAGDLSDPHGTHRVCLDAIFKALELIKGDKWVKDCWVWLYRGAWQEWDIEDIDMAVPQSPDESLKKRRAIFKHQSQKDRPLFPGADVREFWQRAEARNHATAEMYDALGLAEYEAIEAFKRYHF